MHKRHSLLVLALLALLLASAHKASATPPDAQSAPPPSPAPAKAPRPIELKAVAAADATTVVQRKLVEPLAIKEDGWSQFSRSYIPPVARRVRILDRERSTDGRGAEFLAFAVDESLGGFRFRSADGSRRWRKDAIVGCVYPARDEVFVKRGDKFFAVALLWGRKSAAADDTICHAAPAHEPGTPAPSQLAKR